MARNAPNVNYHQRTHLRVANRLKVTAVADMLRQDILLERLKEGEPLLQKPLAEKYRVSAVIVREAFKQLISEGFLEVRWGGPGVVSLTYTEAWNMTLERSNVEPGIIRITAQRMSVEDIENLQRAVLSLDSKKPIQRNIDLDHAIFKYLLGNLGPSTTSPAYGIRYRYRKYRNFLWRFAGELDKHKDDHFVIVSHCANGDAKRASDALWSHIIDTGHSLTARLRDLSDIQYPIAGLSLGLRQDRDLA